MPSSNYLSIAEIPTPAYVVDIDIFQRNYRRFVQAFQAIYPVVQIGYSYKTNYARPIISENKRLGGYAEVVSSMEMDMALGIGHSGEEIYFNGPLKTDAELSRIISLGCKLNIDSLDEAERVAALAEEMGICFAVGLRIAFETDPVLGESRFGIEFPGPEFEVAIKVIENSDFLRLSGVHAHYPQRDISTVDSTAANVAKLVLHLHEKMGLSIDYFSIGGGFSGPMEPEFARQFSREPASFEDYARQCAAHFSGVIEQYRGYDVPTLVLEPGTALVADAIDYICKVHTTKSRGSGRSLAVTDGSSFAMGGISKHIKPSWYVLNSDSDGGDRGVDATSTCGSTYTQIVGYTCVEGDILVEETSESISVGDLVCFRYKGAYSLVMRPPFIRMDEVVITRSAKGGMRLARAKIDPEFCFESYE